MSDTSDAKHSVLEHAVKNCAYYKDYGGKQWDTLPHINKSIVNKNPNDFISSEKPDKHITKTSTSGTSGEVLNIFWGKSEYVKSLMTLWQQRIKYGIYPADKFCTAHAFFDSHFIGYNSLVQINRQKNCLSFNKIFLDDKYLKFYCGEIEKFQPKWLFLQPSIALRLCQYYKQSKTQPPQSVEFIELSGETLTAGIREQLRETFNDAPMANHYGAQEFNCIAYECRCGNMHVNSDNVHIDIDPGENNRFYVTNLMNYTMPLIKYSLGDMAESILPGDSCGCGNKSPMLVLKKGRETDKINIDGAIYDCSLFYYLIDKLNILYDNLFLQFYVEQKKDKFAIYLLPKNKEYAIEIDKIEENVQKTLSAMGIHLNKLRVSISEKLPLSNSGKLNYFKVVK